MSDADRSEMVPVSALDATRRRLYLQKRRETRRARAAEALLREGERLLRNFPDMQRWRRKAAAHLGEYRDLEVRPPDWDEEGVVGG